MGGHASDPLKSASDQTEELSAGDKSGPLRLVGQQEDLYDAFSALSEEGPELARMYHAATTILNTDFPERMVLAAHEIRELMEKLPRYMDVPITATGYGLKGEVRNLHDRWMRAIERTGCYADGNWRGKLDGALRSFLKGLGRFFDRFSAHMPSRREETRQLLRKLDGGAPPLPEHLEDLNVAQWLDMREFFESVAHHGGTTEDQFRRRLEGFEAFSLGRLRPPTFADLDEIDRLIQEGEAGD